MRSKFLLSPDHGIGVHILNHESSHIFSPNFFSDSIVIDVLLNLLLFTDKFFIE
jgi:hypothetical protein